MMPDSAKTASQALMLGSRLTKRLKHLKKWARRVGVEAFRLYDRDIPEIPLALDYYGSAVSGSLYKRPYQVEDEEERLWLSVMSQTIADALTIPPERIFLKTRERQRGKAQYSKLPGQGVTLDTREGDLVFRVNLSNYLDTGLFLDARKARAFVKTQAAGKRVLNLFCYTGAFSVYAASGGASTVDSVDLSKTYLDWAMLNLSLNGFEARRLTSRHAMDVGRFLEEARQRRLVWDLIVLDPPSFSNSKKMQGTFDIRRDHRALIRQCIGLLAPGGSLFFSVNARGFRLKPAEFYGLSIQDLSDILIDEDFQGKKMPSRYLVKTQYAGKDTIDRS
ncbi:MAG: class I SAM-dependent methyltransferase [Treponema sp.]|jgi:23S rRNA G2069 N7-methylase RlmK/C1962 C5-methylase RlmI|nr:class I SAM-dependent methyltransferase [Treponema sp.]